MSDVLQHDDMRAHGPQRFAAGAPLDAARRAIPARTMRQHPAGGRLPGDPHRGPTVREVAPQAGTQDDPSNRKQVAALIRDYLARERLSREQFAFKTRLGKSTVDKLLVGLFSDKTLSVVESHTRLSLRTMMRPHAPAGAGESSHRTPRSDRPSIAVLPFANMSSDLDQAHVVDGLVEDIITALSHVPGLLVIARTSTLAYRAQPVDVREVGRALGVRFVLDGSVRRAASRLRITSQLIDAATGTHLWAGRHDGALDDVFDLQDQVTARVVAAVTLRLSGGPFDAPDCELQTGG